MNSTINQEVAGWQRMRSSQELQSFIDRQTNSLTDSEFDLDLTIDVLS